MSEARPLVRVRNVCKSFGNVKAVRDVSFDVPTGKTFGIVGESGSGKSTVARLILRLVDLTEGKIEFDGTDLLSLKSGALRRQRQHMQMVFQDPFGSFNPRMTIRETLTEPLLVHDLGNEKSRNQRAAELLTEVGLPQKALDKFPHEFSGGQRQRIAVARALATDPQLIIADEPVSALDVSVQAQVLNLMRDLQVRLGTTMIFISHDLRVVQFMCDEIAVMYLGAIVEQGPRDRIYEAPAHPYTRALLSSAPGNGKQDGRRARLTGEIPSAHQVPTGCPFRSRCPLAFDRCANEVPKMYDVGGGQKALCHLLDTSEKAA